MAAQLRKAFGVEPELIKGGGGVFDVTVDGQLVYSKHDTGEFPDARELVKSIRGD